MGAQRISAALPRDWGLNFDARPEVMSGGVTWTAAPSPYQFTAVGRLALLCFIESLSSSESVLRSFES